MTLLSLFGSDLLSLKKEKNEQTNRFRQAFRKEQFKAGEKYYHVLFGLKNTIFWGEDQFFAEMNWWKEMGRRISRGVGKHENVYITFTVRTFEIGLVIWNRFTILTSSDIYHRTFYNQIARHVFHQLQMSYFFAKNTIFWPIFASDVCTKNGKQKYKIAKTPCRTVLQLF